MHADAIGGWLEAEVGEVGRFQVVSKSMRPLLGAKATGLQAIYVDHHQRFSDVLPTFSLEVIGVGACHVIPKATVGHFVEPTVVLAQDREDCVVRVDGPRLKNELALRIDLAFHFLVVPALLLEGEVVWRNSLPEPGEILGVAAVHYGGALQILIAEASGGKGDDAMILSRSSRVIGRAVVSHWRTFFDKRCRTVGLPS